MQVYDGHGGSRCADYMRDNLHTLVINDGSFPEDIEKAIRNGFEIADRLFLSECIKNNIIEDVSGTCACVCIFVEGSVFVVNVGDSRCVLSSEKGKRVESLSDDHKPNSKSEKARILGANGKIYK